MIFGPVQWPFTKSITDVYVGPTVKKQEYEPPVRI